jgi:uncharacterized protein DUF6445
MGQKSFIVRDAFYDDPMAVRSLAIDRAEWLDPKISDGHSYSQETLKGYYTDSLVQRLSDLVGDTVMFDPSTMGFGVFAFYGETSAVDLSTHFDDTTWSGIVYLVPDDINRSSSGIAFYRHRESGLTGPPNDVAAQKLGYASGDEWIREVYYRDKLDPSAWVRTSFIDARFNRLVLLNGSRLFHRATEGFGSEPRDARLTQRFFFHLKSESVAA